MSYKLEGFKKGSFAEESHNIRISLASLKEDTLTCEFGTTSCKDFFQDWYYHETFDKPVSIFGFKSMKTGNLKDKYLIVDISKLPDNANMGKNLERFLSEFVETPEVIQKSGTLMIKFDEKFLSRFYGVSLFTLFARTGIYYSDSYEKVEDFLKGINDVNRIPLKEKAYYTKINDFIIGNILKNDYPQENLEKYKNLKSTSDIHFKTGIVSYVTKALA